MSERTIQAGKLGHYTWIIDEIQLEEVKTQTKPSEYKRPFDKATNPHGIQTSALTNEVAEDLIGLLANLVGLNFNIANVPSKAHLQYDRLKDKKNKKNLKRIKSTQTTLQNSGYIAAFYSGRLDFNPGPDIR